MTTRKIEKFTNRLVAMVSATTPAFLIFCIITLGFFNAALEIIHYQKVVGSLAYVAGFVFGSIRFGSGLGGVKMFMAKDIERGILFICVSLAATIWISLHSTSIAESITLPNQYDNALWFTRTSIWSGLIGEIMLAAYMSHTKKDKKKVAPYWKR